MYLYTAHLNKKSQGVTSQLIGLLMNLCFTVEHCLGGTVVVYNKFDVDSSSQPDSPPRLPNSDYSCVVARTAGRWRVARCAERHLVVCQSDRRTFPGTILAGFWPYFERWMRQNLKCEQRSRVRFPVGPLSSYLGQLSLSSLRDR